MLEGLLKTGLRLSQFLWTLLITALIGNVIALNRNGHMASINFVMFVAVLSWVALLYGLVATFISAVAIPVVMLALDGIATLFTFIAAIVLAARLGVPNCSNIGPRFGSNWIVYGAADTEKRCRELQASTAFLWFLWASFAATFVLTFLDFRRSGGSMRHSRPNMAQVGV